MVSRPTFAELEPGANFVARHIGPDEADTAEMLRSLGAKSLDDFIARVRRETGISLDVISTREEARLAVLGCHILLEPGNGPAMIFDIGGGSTEVVLIESTDTVPEILDWQSVPWGVVSLTETFGPEADDRAGRELRYAAMRDRVAASFASFAQRTADSGTLAQGGDCRNRPVTHRSP